MLDNELNRNSDVQVMNKSSPALAHPFSEMCSSASLSVPETPKGGIVVKVRKIVYNLYFIISICLCDIIGFQERRFPFVNKTSSYYRITLQVDLKKFYLHA